MVDSFHWLLFCFLQNITEQMRTSWSFRSIFYWRLLEQPFVTNKNVLDLIDRSTGFEAESWKGMQWLCAWMTTISGAIGKTIVVISQRDLFLIQIWSRLLLTRVIVWWHGQNEELVGLLFLRLHKKMNGYTLWFAWKCMPRQFFNGDISAYVLIENWFSVV